MIDGWAKGDPPVEKKLAVGIDLPEEACDRGRRSKTRRSRAMAIGDWILIAFYFLLQIGEYTMKATRNDTKQTVQFRMMDVAFFGKEEDRLTLLPDDPRQNWNHAAANLGQSHELSAIESHSERSRERTRFYAHAWCEVSPPM